MKHQTPLSLDCTFLNAEQVRAIAANFGSPVAIYDESRLRGRARQLRAMPNAFGLRPRFAMKACPTAAVLQIIHDEGIGIDASSGYEVERALLCGIPISDISLTAQELPGNLGELLAAGMDVNACSLEQLRLIGEALHSVPQHSRAVGVRLNPGLGSGHSNRTNVGGPSAGFGIWRDYVSDVKEIASQYSLRIVRAHSHIGAGTDPSVWEKAARMTLELALEFPEVETVSLGGGFKVARMPDEKESNLQETGERIAVEFQKIQMESGRVLTLEVEPGAYLLANAGAILSRIIDLTDTGSDGYRFIKLDCGMTEIIRPSMYGAQHPLIVVPKDATDEKSTGNFLVIGHCCESGDILTPEPGNPEGLAPRTLLAPAIGDFLVIGATGAYTSGFSALNYNSFPQCAEVLIRQDGTFTLIRKRQELKQIVANEIPLRR